MNNITFVKGKGGLGRPQAGKDFISGMVFYTATLPSGFTTTSREKVVYSLEDAVALGITADYSDETQATGTVTVTAAGAVGDQITLNFTEPGGKVVTIGSYVKQTGDTTPTLVALGLSNAINALTSTTGYSSTALAAVITITVRKGLGVYPNTGTPLAIVVTGTVTASQTAFTGGVASLKAVWNYHISEFFRINATGFLWLGFYAVPTTYTFTELSNLQRAASGDIRQAAVYVDGKAYDTADLGAIQSVCNTLDAAKTPMSVVLAPNIKTVVTISTLADLSTFTSNKVSVVIAQDGAGQGSILYLTSGKSITTMGATLGAISLASVEQDIAWVGGFNMSNGTELESLAFANGVSFNDVSVTDTLLNSLDLKRYLFLRKFANYSGSFFNDDHTAIAITSDYAYISSNRVIDKAIRGVYASLLPNLNSTLILNSDGTLANSTISYLTGVSTTNTDQMVRDGEASAISCAINPNQNVASTSTITIAISIVPVGVARNIVVNVGFKTTI